MCRLRHRLESFRILMWPNGPLPQSRKAPERTFWCFRAPAPVVSRLAAWGCSIFNPAGIFTSARRLAAEVCAPGSVITSASPCDLTGTSIICAGAHAWIPSGTVPGRVASTHGRRASEPYTARPSRCRVSAAPTATAWRICSDSRTGLRPRPCGARFTRRKSCLPVRRSPGGRRRARGLACP